MSDNLLQRYARPVTRTVEPTPLSIVESTGDEASDCGAFGYLRGLRERAIMLELRKKDGNIKAIGYAWLSQAEFDPSVGITLHVAGQQIRIVGRNLNAEVRPNVRLFESLLRHRVLWIQESDEPTLMQAPPEATMIERILW